MASNGAKIILFKLWQKWAVSIQWQTKSQTNIRKHLTCTMSLSANFPREEILMSSPSSSTMATEKRCFMLNISILWIINMYNFFCAWGKARINLNKTNHPWCKQTTNLFPLFFVFVFVFVSWRTLVTVLTIKLSLANSNNDDRHGEFSCLSWTRRTSNQLSLRCWEEHASAFLSLCEVVTFQVICIYLTIHFSFC